MNKKTEVIANICLAATGLIFGVVFFLMDKKELSLILFSLAIASILYQFLGGIGQENTFQLGAMKFGGAAAVLIGFMYFLKSVIFVPGVEAAPVEINPDKDWIPISLETGKIKPVWVTAGQDTAIFPDPSDHTYTEIRKNHEYQLSALNRTRYTLELKDNPKDTIGYIDLRNIRSPYLFSRVKIADDDDMQVFMLYPGKPGKTTTANLPDVHLPFEVKVSGGKFSIDSFYVNRDVKSKECYLISTSDREAYVVFIEQAYLIGTDPENWFSKWIVKKIEMRKY